MGARGVPERFLAPNAPPPPTAVLVGDDGNGGGIVGESGSGNTRSAGKSRVGDEVEGG